LDEKHRIPVDPPKLQFLVLNELNLAAGELYNGLLDEKQDKLLNPSKTNETVSKRKVTERLKWKDPW